MSTLDSPLAGEVRRAMQWRADQLEATPDPQALIERGVREDRRHRRVVRTRVVAALLGLALVVLLVDVLRPTPPAPDPAARVAAGPAASGALVTWAVRGSLSGSIATLAEATRRLSRENLTVDRLLYAGDVGPDRLVLALVDPPGRERRDPGDIGPAGDSADHPQRDVIALFGRAGAPVDILVQEDPTRVLADATVLTWSHQQRSAAPLLVLTGSATRSARLSDEPVYDNGGGLTRTWRTVPLVNGVWAGRTGPKGPALARVQVGGYDGGVEVRDGAEPDPDDGVYDYASADYRLVSLVSDFARSHQVPAEGIDPHVLYDGRDGAGTFLVVALHLPDGTAFQTALVENRFPDGTSYTTYPVQGRPVAAADADHHPVVYVEASADDAGSSPVRVVAPGAALVRIVGGVLPGSPPSVMAEIRVDGAGFGTRNLPGSLVWQTQGWQVQSLDADGHELGRWPLVGQHDEDPLDVLPR